ncbi:MAG: hypothetical protein R3251_02995 [Candidatus Spechtbacterales bacterium]|nr:hypothetical protein [Candidatus Spechtbacterales bacterium]
MTEENDKNLKELEARRDKVVNKTFILMLEILVIFGMPAAIAFFLGAWLDSTFETGGKTLQLASLAVAFVASWIITIAKYRKINRQLEDLDKKIKELKNN